MGTWIERHLEKVVVTVLACGIVPEAVSVFVTHGGPHRGPNIRVLEIGLLMWCLLAPVATVWRALSGRSLQEDRKIRALVVYLMVCGYAGVAIAMTIPR